MRLNALVLWRRILRVFEDALGLRVVRMRHMEVGIVGNPLVEPSKCNDGRLGLGTELGHLMIISREVKDERNHYHRRNH